VLDQVLAPAKTKRSRGTRKARSSKAAAAKRRTVAGATGAAAAGVVTVKATRTRSTTERPAPTRSTKSSVAATAEAPVTGGTTTPDGDTISLAVAAETGDSDTAARSGVYAEMNHPADLFLEIWGRDLPTLFENALFALYDHLVRLEGFESRRQETIETRAPTLPEALRSLLSEALYRFAVEGFVAVQTEVEVESLETNEVRVVARLNGENADRERHNLLTEVKAVTYHQLAVDSVPEGGWRATVLLDV
jgi:SHS2 domain-containing protein